LSRLTELLKQCQNLELSARQFLFERKGYAAGFLVSSFVCSLELSALIANVVNNSWRFIILLPLLYVMTISTYSLLKSLQRVFLVIATLLEMYVIYRHSLTRIEHDLQVVLFAAAAIGLAAYFLRGYAPRPPHLRRTQNPGTKRGPNSHWLESGDEKKCYWTQIGAERGARSFERSRPGEKMNSYKCATCRWWHTGHIE